MSGSYVVLPADYLPHGSRIFAGHPLVETLRIFDKTVDEVHSRLAKTPAPPTDRDRRASETDRLDDLHLVNDVVYARTGYKRIAADILGSVKVAYRARNLITTEDHRRRQLIAQSPKEKFLLPSNWRSSAKGITLLGPSGTGKTTLWDVLSLPLQVVYEHENYKGTPLHCRQIPAVCLQIPFDATLKSFCIQYFTTIDEILGLDGTYEREARRVGGIAEMVILMGKVATTVSLGLLFIDDIQNLRVARGPMVEHLLNLISQLIEKAGIGVLVAGTPAFEKVVPNNVRNLRKLTSGGDFRLDMMGRLELSDFQDLYWDYQWVKKKGRLTPEIRKAWVAVSAGNPAFTVLSYQLAQRMEIGRDEVLTERSFADAFRYKMSGLQPAIRALRLGHPDALREFDDLLFTSEYAAVRRVVGWRTAMPNASSSEEEKEFDEIQGEEEEQRAKAAHAVGKKSASGKATKNSTRGKKMNPNSRSKSLPLENPFTRH